MKIVFLLALASGLSGLASCKSILPGGDQAKNVELEYTYIDEFGKPIKVKVQSDLINLSGIREVEEKEPEASFVKIAAELSAPQVEFKPLVKTIYVTALEPEPRLQYVVQPPATRTIEVEVPQPEVRYVLQHGVPQAIKLDTQETEMQFVVQHPVPRAIEVKKPEVHITYVQAPASSVPISTIEIKAPEPKVVYVTAPEHRAIKLDIDVREPEDSHIFVTPSVKRTIEVKTSKPEIKHVVPAHFVVPTHASKTLKTKTKKVDKKSNDDDDFGSAEK